VIIGSDGFGFAPNEKGNIIFRIRHLIQDQHAPCLGHGFNLDHTRHHGVSRKMSFKKRLVHGHILYANNIILSHLHDLVDEEEWWTVREKTLDIHDIEQRLLRKVN